MQTNQKYTEENFMFKRTSHLLKIYHSFMVITVIMRQQIYQIKKHPIPVQQGHYQISIISKAASQISRIRKMGFFFRFFFSFSYPRIFGPQDQL